jgi:hypothetical protein
MKLRNAVFFCVVLVLCISVSAEDANKENMGKKVVIASDAVYAPVDGSDYVVVESKKAPAGAVDSIERNLWVVGDGGRSLKKGRVLGVVPSEKKVKDAVENGLVKVVFYGGVSREEMEKAVSMYGVVIGFDEGAVFINLSGDFSADDIAGEDVVFSVESVKELVSYNNGTRIYANVNFPQSIFNLTGSGVVAGIWDEGFVEINHTDFAGRVTNPDTCKHAGDSEKCSAVNHSTHVGGTLGGKGVKNSSFMGQAPNVSIISWGWTETVVEVYNETNVSVANFSASVSQNSWGYLFCYNGDYDSLTQAFDTVVFGNKSYADKVLTVVFSAGNNGVSGFNSTCGPGGTGRNVITVGSVDYDDLEISSYSSLGPTDDGRTKPDIVAPGCGTYSSHQIKSTFQGDSYGEMCGTSMAAPVVSGIIALMHEGYNKTYGSRLLPSTDKAILVQTATDLGNEGPDFTYGWGLVNAKKALKAVVNGSNAIVQGNITEDLTYSHLSSLNYSFNVSYPIDKLRVTLAWSDPPLWTTLGSDLDVWVTAPNGTSFFAWKLDKSNPSAPAYMAPGLDYSDGSNNVEQIEVSNPALGQWNISVNGYYVSLPPQQFSLVFYQAFDNSSPNVSVVSPSQGQNSTFFSKVLNVSVLDMNEVVNCTFQVENVNYSQPMSPYAANKSCNITAVFSGRGAKRVGVFVQDYYGNWKIDNISVAVMNSAPEVNVSRLPGNFSARENESFVISVNAADVNGDNLTFSWSLNSSVIASAQNLSYLFGFSDSANYSLLLNVSDGENFTVFYWNLSVNNTNQPPNLTIVSLSPSSIYTDDNISCSYVFSDPDGDFELGTAINWIVNGSLNNAFQNQTIINSTYTSRGANWTCEIVAVDSLGGSYRINSSVVVLNSAPVLSTPPNIVVNESELVNISLSAGDADGDALLYSSNLSYFSSSGANFFWLTNYSVSGIYSAYFNVSDGSAVSSSSGITVTVRDVARLNGNSSSIASSVALAVFINNSVNESELSGVNAINITDSLNVSLVEFSWNFSRSNISVNVDYAPQNGTVVIRNLNLSSQGLTKSVYINRSSSSFNYVCVVDAEVDSIGALSSDCSRANETKIACPGSSGAFSCSVAGGFFRVSGLSSTAVKGITVSSGNNSDSTGGSGGGGGGGGIDDAVVVPPCDEDWVCGSWGSCSGGVESRQCFDINGCGAKNSEPAVERKCEAGLAAPSAESSDEKTASGDELSNKSLPKSKLNSRLSDRVYLVFAGAVVPILIVFTVFLVRQRRNYKY